MVSAFSGSASYLAIILYAFFHVFLQCLDPLTRTNRAQEHRPLAKKKTSRDSG